MNTKLKFFPAALLLWVAICGPADAGMKERCSGFLGSLARLEFFGKSTRDPKATPKSTSENKLPKRIAPETPFSTEESSALVAAVRWTVSHDLHFGRGLQKAIDDRSEHLPILLRAANSPKEAVKTLAAQQIDDYEIGGPFLLTGKVVDAIASGELSRETVRDLLWISPAYPQLAKAVANDQELTKELQTIRGLHDDSTMGELIRQRKWKPVLALIDAGYTLTPEVVEAIMRARNSRPVVERYFEKNPGALAHESRKGLRPLEIAMMIGDLKMVKKMVELGALDRAGRILPTTSAALYEEPEILDYLLQVGAKLPPNRESLYEHPVINNDLRTLQVLLDHGVPFPLTKNEHGKFEIEISALQQVSMGSKSYKQKRNARKILTVIQSELAKRGLH